MLRNMLMLSLVLFVVATAAAVLTWFFGRLRQIERMRWGDIEDSASLSASFKRVKLRLAARRAQKME